MDHGTKHAVQLVRADLLRCRTAQTRWTEHTVQLGGWPSWIEHVTRSAIRRAGPAQFGKRPSRTQDGFSSAVRRANERIQLGRSPSWTSPVPRTAELDQPSLANGRAGPEMDSARPVAELDQSSSINGRAGSIGVRLSLVLVTPLPKIALNSFLVHLDRSHRWNFMI
ncbi:hypothetical protein F2Q69_00013672 [Brassica cretica]|uniref:Uncharacterized protein n=1 Tax=Brassica cretica TaxID=69181 RepID=A0A8S9QKF1_BRACR|nr:hypothetical protein F2Q69_00013672 [Brassica cretica]